MKLLTLITSALISVATFAQTTEGKVTYSIDYSSDNPEMAAYLGMMTGSTMELSFMPGKSRVEMKMGAMGTVVTIADEKSKKTLSLTNAMGQKLAMEGAIDESQNTQTTAKGFQFTKVDETKTIAGFTCKKVIVTTQTGEEMIMWYTTDITAYSKGQQFYNGNIPGFPLEYSTTTQGMKMKFTATSVENKVSDKKIFDMKIPDGYTKKTQEELMQQMGGGQ